MILTRDYIDKVIKNYGYDISSLDYNNTNYKVGKFYSDFNVENDNSAVFQIYNTCTANNLYFEVDDEELSYMNDYEMIQFDSYDGIILITVGDLLKGEVTKLYKEVEF